MKCLLCDREFSSQRACNAHQIVHTKRDSRYKVPRTHTRRDAGNPAKTSETFNCKHCGKEKRKSASSRNLFCSIRCTKGYKWEHEYKPQILEGKTSNVNSLKRFLCEERGNVCEECGQEPTHNNKPLSLQLDHIDGDSDNNIPDNLRLLCPNCHTQTPTYGAKGKGNRYKKLTKRNTYIRKYRGSEAP